MASYDIWHRKESRECEAMSSQQQKLTLESMIHLTPKIYEFRGKVASEEEKRQHSTWSKKRLPFPPDRASSPPSRLTSPLLPAPHPYTGEAVGRARWGSTAHSTPAALAHADSRAERLQGGSGNRSVPISVPPRLAEKSGPRRRWRERATRPLPRGGRATEGYGHRLCCIRGCALRSAQTRSDPEPARCAAFPSPSAAAPRAAPPGETHVRSSFAGFTDFRGQRILPQSLPASLGLSPPPRDSPTPWARARAHTHTHTHTHSHSQARVRTPARPEPRSLQQIPLSRAPLLTQASSRHGASSVCGSSGGGSTGNRSCSRAASCSFVSGTESGRSGRGGRQGEEEPRRAQRPAPGSRLRAAGCPRSRYRGSRFLKAA
ncbi:uncharacterized protein LOC125934010 [Panthera uncia]|uniref:uncharacterized protein LOC125934010 n=1 Tax=Panthera uncia TaxID=29064 RepID=UPI0020FFBED9|nr:uncharacterized protein LOC125934010 [Panthera uncia]